MPPPSPGQSEQGNEPIERIDDGDPIAVVPPATPGKKRSQTVRALPVHEKMTGHGETDAQGDPPPSRTLVLFVSSSEQRQEPYDECKGHGLDGGAEERVGDATVQCEIVDAAGARPEQELGPVRRIGHDRTDDGWVGRLSIRHRSTQRCSHECMRKIVHQANNTRSLAGCWRQTYLCGPWECRTSRSAAAGPTADP